MPNRTASDMPAGREKGEGEQGRREKEVGADAEMWQLWREGFEGAPQAMRRAAHQEAQSLHTPSSSDLFMQNNTTQEQNQEQHRQASWPQ